jgi:ribosomal protein S18 acetylase RimI-like enzyme
VSATDGALARALDFERQTVEMVADEVTPIPQGWVSRAPSLPLVWSLNHVGVTRPLQFAEALELVEELQAALPYRQLTVEHAAAGERLEAAFRADRWRIGRDVVMVLAGSPDREVDTSAVVEAGEEETLQLMGRWSGEDEQLTANEEGHRQVLEATRLAWRARRGRHLGVVGDGDTLAGMTTLYCDGAVAQVEDVYVVPEARGRGFGRALVTHAVALAQQSAPELTFVVADDEGWPKLLYSRIGFEPVGRTWNFHRDAGR